MRAFLVLALWACLPVPRSTVVPVYPTNGQPVALVTVPYTGHLSGIVMDSILVGQTLTHFRATFPKESVVCLTLAIEQHRIVRVVGVYPARLNDATDSTASWDPQGPPWGCESRLGFGGTVHIHPLSSTCDLAHTPSHPDILSMSGDPRLLLIAVFCVDGSAVFMMRDGRRFAHRWSRP